MPRKAMFTRDDIIAAALEITRSSGTAAVTARELGARLGCSSRPMFTFFDTVEELRAAVFEKAVEIYLEKMKVEGFIESSSEPFYSLGQAQLDFIAEEPQLWQLISGDPIRQLELVEQLASDLAEKNESAGLDRDSAHCLALQVILAAESMSPYLAMNEVKEARLGFDRVYLALLKAFKELPALASEGFDRAKLSREINELPMSDGRKAPAPRRSRSGSFESWID